MLMEKKWHYKEGYAAHTVYRYPASPTILYMHKYIVKPPVGKYTDHINCNGLDNRRSNLRVATRSQNMMNKRAADNTKSGYKGVTFDPRHDLWQARIGIDGRRINLGTRRTAREAAELYVKAARELHGEYMHPSVTKALV